MNKIFKQNNFRMLFFISAILILLIPMISFAEEKGVRVFIDQVAQSLIDTMKEPGRSTEYKRGQIKTIIDKNFDVTWMSQFAMGVYYDKLSDDQKSKYASLYLNYLLNNYFPILMKYDSDDSYVILRIQKVDQKDHDIKIKLVTKKSENPIMLNYRVRSSDTDYKCLDMIVEGVSTLVSQRAEFISIIQSSGVNVFLKDLESQHVKSIEYNTGG
jgi:phospholipid transport system substrate-binding protein